MQIPYADEITVGDVRVDWDRVRPGLLKIKGQGGVDWRVEDIYAMCRNGESTLYLFDRGFVIASIYRNQFTLEKDLHFNAVYSEMSESCMKYFPFFEGLAGREGATSITMQSKKPVFECYGWEVDCINYKRSL